jgi:ABC-type branched-subunit amino acid transport system substrate-binding protein
VEFMNRGNDMCRDEINSDQEVLPNHVLFRLDLKLGATSFNYDWARKHLDPLTREDMGYAFFTPYSSGVSMGLMSVFAEKQWDMPIYGATNTAMALTNNADWPMYSRVIISDLYMANIFVSMFQRFGWKKASLIYSDEPWGIGMYTEFITSAEAVGIEITTPVELRPIDPNITRESIKKYREVFQDIVDSDNTIVVIMCLAPIPERSLEFLYDLGLRRGKNLFFGVEYLSYGMFVGDPEEVKKKEELILGSVQFLQKTFIGDKGDQFYSNY